MDTDVLAKRLTASGAVYAGRTRVRGVYLVGGTTAGTVQLKVGGSGGTILVELDTPANTAAANVIPVYVEFPKDGVLFSSDVYATFTGGVASVNVFYG
jgi:hypothetical protein